MTIFHFKEAPTPPGRMPESHCPECDELLDGAISLDDPVGPQPGDVSICAYCGELLMFVEGMQLERMPPEIFNELPLFTKTELIMVQTKIRESGSPFV